MKTLRSIILLCLPSLFCFANPPKLIVQIVVDQLRGDLIRSYDDKLSPNGFKRLLAHGINYQNAYHPHANTTTCAGHTTISTGAYPALHGIIANEWYNRETKQITNCVEDSESPLTIAPNLQTKTDGRSPKNIMTSTLSDEIMLANRGRAFGVSFKDRGAISLAGHAGKALWFDKSHGGFISSRYYYQTLPEWVTHFNQLETPTQITWTLSLNPDQYRYHQTPKFIQKEALFNTPFPHVIKAQDHADFYKLLSSTPKADALTADLAIEIIQKEHLGMAPHQTDYLGISFSTNDVIGHAFGPNSIEAEDNLLKLDLTLGHLLDAIDKQVGLDNTLIILSADHGVTDSSLYLTQHHIPTPLPPSIKLIESTIKQTLVNQFHLPETTLLAISPPYIYLDHDILDKQSMPRDRLLSLLAEKLEDISEIYRVLPMPVKGFEKDWLSAKVDKMAYPDRMGDLYIILPPNHQLFPDDETNVSHGSPWAYDSYVPLIIAQNFKPVTITREVHTTDIAPTLAMLLGIKPPSGTVGQPLAEVLDLTEPRP